MRTARKAPRCWRRSAEDRQFGLQTGGSSRWEAGSMSSAQAQRPRFANCACPVDSPPFQSSLRMHAGWPTRQTFRGEPKSTSCPRQVRAHAYRCRSTVATAPPGARRERNCSSTCHPAAHRRRGSWSRSFGRRPTSRSRDHTPYSNWTPSFASVSAQARSPLSQLYRGAAGF